MDNAGFVPVGTGLTVYQDDGVVEGPVVWLDSPSDVVAFASGDNVKDSIVVARGGTTTFLTPALTGGVKGVITLQGAPESHLGILVREYGIPCLMSVSFDHGVRSGRGEVIPADGVQVRMDVSTSPRGEVWVEENAPTSDAAVAETQGPNEEEAAQIQRLLEHFQGDVPHGVEGDARIRAELSTDVLLARQDNTVRDLTRQEVADHLRYMAWNFWDCLALRATEGESGLIPRQEYEALGLVNMWQRMPGLMRAITDAVGAEGITEIGATARREIGTKINVLHCWALGTATLFGRGIAIGLGRCRLGEREGDVATALQFARRLLRGVYGDDGPLYASMRNGQQPILEDHWLERFAADRVAIDDPEVRRRHQRFSGSTELMGFLVHFDNRNGLSDTGPYPTDDGGFVIVRDHFLHDDLYSWSDVSSHLPYAITQAMYFHPDEPLDKQVIDLGTLFTRPANYLKHLSGLAVYARDRWDTPVEEIRRVDDDEMDRIAAACEAASSQLYRRIASMPKRDRIMAGAQVYSIDFIAPIAKAAGMWDRLRDEYDAFELDPVAAEAYYDLVKGGAAVELVPRLFITGDGIPGLA